jgi:hypothetical protein
VAAGRSKTMRVVCEPGHVDPTEGRTESVDRGQQRAGDERRRDAQLLADIGAEFTLVTSVGVVDQPGTARGNSVGRVARYWSSGTSWELTSGSQPMSMLIRAGVNATTSARRPPIVMDVMWPSLPISTNVTGTHTPLCAGHRQHGRTPAVGGGRDVGPDATRQTRDAVRVVQECRRLVGRDWLGQ